MLVSLYSERETCPFLLLKGDALLVIFYLRNRRRLILGACLGDAGALIFPDRRWSSLGASPISISYLSFLHSVHSFMVSQHKWLHWFMQHKKPNVSSQWSLFKNTSFNFLSPSDLVPLLTRRLEFVWEIVEFKVQISLYLFVWESVRLKSRSIRTMCFIISMRNMTTLCQ
jgi:hypothetical protein